MPRLIRPVLLAALPTVFLYGVLALTTFPARLQFNKYPRAAAQYLAGTLEPERLLDFSPFYFYLHVVQEVLIDGQIVVWLQVLAMGAAAVLLYLLLGRFFAPWVAVAGTAAFVLSPGAAVYALILEPEPFLLLFLLGFLYFASGAGPRAWLAAGVSLALAVSVRPSALPLALVLPLHVRWAGAGRGWIRASAWALTPVIAVLLGLGVRNGLATGSFSPLAMNPGFVFYEGNNPLASGRTAVYPPSVGELRNELQEHPDNPHMTYRLIARRESGGDLTTGAANDYWRARARAYMADHPGRALALNGSKALAVFRSHRAHDLLPAQRFDEALARGPLPLTPFSVIAALALIGLVALAPRWRGLLPIYAAFGSPLLVMVLLYASERQRLAMLPAFVFFAAAGLTALTAAARSRALLGAAVAAALAFALSRPTARDREDRHLWSAFARSDAAWEEAVRLRERGELTAAADAAALALGATPWLADRARPAGIAADPRELAAIALDRTEGSAERDPSRRLDRAQLLILAGRLDEADSLLAVLQAEGHTFDRGFHHSSAVGYQRARVAIRRGRAAEAADLLADALSRAPGDPWVLAALAALTGDDGFRARLVRYFGETDADYLIALAQTEQRSAAAALRPLLETVRRMPELWRARMYLAAALLESGEVEEGLAIYREAVRERPDPVLLEGPVLTAFSEAVAAAPADAELRFEHGMALLRYGKLEGALVELRAADALGRPAAAAVIAQVERLLGR